MKFSVTPTVAFRTTCNLSQQEINERFNEAFNRPPESESFGIFSFPETSTSYLGNGVDASFTIERNTYHPRNHANTTLYAVGAIQQSSDITTIDLDYYYTGVLEMFLKILLGFASIFILIPTLILIQNPSQFTPGVLFTFVPLVAFFVIRYSIQYEMKFFHKQIICLLE